MKLFYLAGYVLLPTDEATVFCQAFTKLFPLFLWLAVPYLN